MRGAVSALSEKGDEKDSATANAPGPNGVMRCFPIIRPDLRALWTQSHVPISARRCIGQINPSSTNGEATSDAENQPAILRPQEEDGPEQDALRKPQLQSASSPSSKLPLSPLMDPNLIAARQRYRTPKPPPSGERSPFSQKLERNPYAQALATPVRQCRFTGLRLPAYFHLDFGLQRHPATGKPWHLPKLASTAGFDAADKGKGDHAQGGDGVSESQELPSIFASETTTQREKPLRTMTGTYFAAQRATIQFISGLNKQQYSKLFPYRWKSAAALNTQDIVWREDMDTYVLELMRKNLMRDLQYMSSRQPGHVASSTYEQVGSHPQLGAALWLGAWDSKSSISVEGTGTDGEADLSIGSAGPPPYATLDYRGRYIPVFNLQTLLGNQPLEQLRGSNSIFQGEIAVIREERNTVKVQMALWKLMGYLAEGV